MQRHWRWTVVALATALLVSLPLAARLLPGGDSDIDARTLLGRITSSADVPFSGFVQSRSGLSVPVDSRAFGSLDDLFGATQQLRVWWRGTQDWRVDSLALTGETDLHRDATGLWTWDYESASARRSTAKQTAQVRLPRTDDLLPPTLARRLLSEAAPGDVSRLAGVRVAGEQTAGLRLHITDTRSTIDHIDVWARPGDGLPLRVDVVADSTSVPVVSTSFLDVSTTRPTVADTAFRPTSGTEVRTDDFGDIVSAIDRLGESRPPSRIAGLPRRTDLTLGSVGAYGRGATLLVAVPLSGRLAGEIEPELRRAPGVVEDANGLAAGVGPLNLQLSPASGRFGARWLLVGTATAKTLRTAVAELPPAQGFRFFR